MNLYKLADLYYKLAGEVIDLQSFRKRKETEQPEEQLISLFETMDMETLLSGDVTVDSMHQARKAAGFPSPPPKSPPWLHYLLSIIDTPDAKKRNSKYKRFLHAYTTTKEQAAEDFKKEQENFIKDCKDNKIKFFTIKNWILDYPLIFDDAKSLKSNFINKAIELLKTQHKLNVLKELEDCSVTQHQNPKDMPVGTTLYLIKNLKDIYRADSYSKMSDGDWISSDGFMGNNTFVSRLLKGSTKYEPQIFTKPIEYFKDLLTTFDPDEASIINTIDYILLHHPERVFEHSWVGNDLREAISNLPWVIELERS